MYAYANSYTSGSTLNIQSWNRTTTTTGSKTPEATSEPLLTHSTSSKSWMRWALDQLDDIAKLGPNWDSYGGDPPSRRAIIIASTLLQTVHDLFGNIAPEQSQPQIIAPRADGGVQIEWSAQSVEIAVHVDPSGTLGYLYIHQQDKVPTYEEEPNSSWDKILQLIAWVVFTVPI
jgi:hypothetical protein